MAREQGCFSQHHIPCLSLQHKYTSIAEVQAQMEEEFLRSPLSGVSLGAYSHGVPNCSQSLNWAWSTKLLLDSASKDSSPYPALSVPEQQLEYKT